MSETSAVKRRQVVLSIRRSMGGGGLPRNHHASAGRETSVGQSRDRKEVQHLGVRAAQVRHSPTKLVQASVCTGSDDLGGVSEDSGRRRPGVSAI